MIISCIDCNKKFEIDKELIPQEGRLLQCGNCNNQWFFKDEINIEKKSELGVEIKQSNKNNLNEKTTDTQFLDDENKKTTDTQFSDDENKKTTDTQFLDDEDKKTTDTQFPDDEDKKTTYKKNNKPKFTTLNLILVFIITSMAIIIVVDTFKGPISDFIPNVDFLLTNLYETVKDVILFFNVLFLVNYD